MKKVLLIGLEYEDNSIQDVLIHTKGLADPKLCPESAALPLYEYNVIIFNPQSYSHLIFGKETPYSRLETELQLLKKENNNYDIDTILDYTERQTELDIAIKGGTTVIWLAVEDKKENFFGRRSLYKWYLSPEIGKILNQSWIYCKNSTKLEIKKASYWNDYFDELTKSGWKLSWHLNDPDYEPLCTSLEGYCLGLELLINAKNCWLITPPTSAESLVKLLQISLNLNGQTYEKLPSVDILSHMPKQIPHSELEHYFKQINLLIITATKTETQELKNYIVPLDGHSQVLEGAYDDLTYTLGKFGHYNMVHFQSGMGTTGRDAATLSTFEAIKKWNPKAIVMVGIAFGRDSGKQRICDVLISETISSYESMRVGATQIIPRGSKERAGQVLLDRFRNISDWKFPDPKPEIRIGELLSGDKLVDDQRFKEQLFELFPNAIGGEMEGAGVLAAALRARVPEWIVVKAICDWGDGNKNKDFQKDAAKAAVSLCYAVFSKEYAFDQLLCSENISIDYSGSTNNVLEGDIKRLADFAESFSGDKMHCFFEELQTSRTINLRLISDFDCYIERYFAPDKRLRHNLLEEARMSFLAALKKFLFFTCRTFSTLPNINYIKFYAGISEHDIMTKHHVDYEKDNQTYLDLLSQVYTLWNTLHSKIGELIPEFTWP